jgi:hypothetical protein
MSSLSQFSGGTRIASSLVGTPPVSIQLANSAAVACATLALTGVCAAGVLKTALSITGKGCVNWLALFAADATARTLRIKITSDGVVIRDFTSTSLTTSLSGTVAVGASASVNIGGLVNSVVFQPVYFGKSMLIEIASSLSETDKSYAAYNYEVH